MHNQNKEGVDLDKLRAEFEVDASDNGKWPRAVERNADSGGYVLAQTHCAWLNWQRAAEAIARRAEPSVAAGDERALGALAAITNRLGLTYNLCCGLAPKQAVGELLEVTINMPEWEIVHAALASPAVSQKAATEAPAAQTNPSTAILHDGVWYVPYVTPSTQLAVSQKDGAAVEMMKLLQDAARAWNNENEPALDAAMEEIECFLIDFRATPAATVDAPADTTVDSQEDTTTASASTECKNCDGSGRGFVWGSSMESPMVDVKCGTCNGTGRAQAPSRDAAPKIETWQERLTGNEDEDMGTHFEAMQAEITDLRAALANSGASHAANAGADTAAANDVLTERRRQVEQEGWSNERDDKYTDCSLARAAAAYALAASADRADRAVMDDFSAKGIPAALWEVWPPSWQPAWFKPKSRRADLVKAGTLILAEIERLDRAAIASSAEQEKPV